MLDPTPACSFYDRKEGNIADIEEWKKPRPFSEEEVFSTLPPPATCHVFQRMRRRHAGVICEFDGDMPVCRSATATATPVDATAASGDAREVTCGENGSR